ncbi:MAG: M48 family metalloprotease [Parachlamydiaceae bacterium]|nr:M48 family metalloprotease [Parachlamydiaceae bacterium]
MNPLNFPSFSVISENANRFFEDPKVSVFALTVLFASFVFKRPKPCLITSSTIIDEKKMKECGEVLSQPTIHAREIAKLLGVANPHEFTVYAFPKKSDSSMLAMMMGSSIIMITSQQEKALRSDPDTRFTREEAEGVLAHEIGHATLGHHHADHPLKASYNFFYDHEYDFNDPASSKKLDTLHYASLRAQEREADLFTIRNSQLAQGLINRLKREQIGKPPEISSPMDSHPTITERVAYLIEALSQQTGRDDLVVHCFSNHSQTMPRTAP